MNPIPLFSTQKNLFRGGFVLFVLAVFDSISTDFGLRQAHIEEANPLMRIVYETDVILFYALKISLPILLLMLIRTLKPRRIISLLMGTALLLYGAVFIQHIFWLTIVSRFS